MRSAKIFQLESKHPGSISDKYRFREACEFSGTTRIPLGAFKARPRFSNPPWLQPGDRDYLGCSPKLKHTFAVGELHEHRLSGKNVCTIFYNTSLRTHDSLELGMTQLGSDAYHQSWPRSRGLLSHK